MILGAAGCLGACSVRVPKRVLSCCQWKLYAWGECHTPGKDGYRRYEIREDPFSFRFSPISASPESGRPAEGAWATE